MKIVSHPARGANGLAGVWRYERDGREVIGSFTGELRGAILNFVWEEPTPSGSPLRGEGSLEFDQAGTRFNGQWWTDSRDRGGQWQGWREQSTWGTATP